MPMKGSVVVFFIVYSSLLLGGSVVAQTKERPQWSPQNEKHRNIRDELGRKQGLWKYYSYSKVLTYEVTFMNDVKHGPSMIRCGEREKNNLFESSTGDQPPGCFDRQSGLSDTGFTS